MFFFRLWSMVEVEYKVERNIGRVNRVSKFRKVIE